MQTSKMFRFAAASVLALGVATANAASVGSATFAGTTGTYDYMDVASDSITVSTVVIANCTIDANNLNLGNYDPIVEHRDSANWLQTDSIITTQCTKGSSPKITLASANGLKLKKGTDELNYSLHASDADLIANIAWPVAGQAVLASGQTDETTDIYVKLPGGQDMPVGYYSDTVTVDISF